MARAKKNTRSKRGDANLDDEGFEILGGDQTPMAIGEVVMGPFRGIARTVPSIVKGKPPVPVYQVGARTILGSAVLKNRLEEGEVKEGDYLKVTRLEDGKAKKGQNAPKIYDVRVKRGAARASA